jgi:hypothetical protein
LMKKLAEKGHIKINKNQIEIIDLRILWYLSRHDKPKRWIFAY